ncbi:hypothetical protein [Lacticaseibacillus yichunensis]|uniref:D-alanyl-D-alanine carboxypeptidase n=1 Tax=Lacticaseibacillus yichunensis TaxID=2486015 RepID=A0ABW4CSI0_9LACO|nr:hypothetical protein [Lacticaseibacillus yichunensis]
MKKHLGQWLIGAALFLGIGLSVAKPTDVQAATKHYVTVTAANFKTWQDAKLTKTGTATSSLVNKTFYYTTSVKPASVRYLKLVDTNGKSWGYLNENATKAAPASYGACLPANYYVSVTSKNFKMYKNFDWQVARTSASVVNQTFHVKYVHPNFSGAQFLSVYNKSNKLVGIVNATATKKATGQQGIAHVQKFNATISNTGATIWKGFGFTSGVKASSYKSTQLVVHGWYQHYNGSKYYTVYTTGNKWIGYINASCVKAGNVTKTVAKKTTTPAKTTTSTNLNRTVYVAPLSGKKYHFDKNCRALKNAKSIQTLTLKVAIQEGYTLCGYED